MISANIKINTAIRHDNLEYLNIYNSLVRQLYRDNYFTI